MEAVGRAQRMEGHILHALWVCWLPSSNSASPLISYQAQLIPLVFSSLEEGFFQFSEVRCSIGIFQDDHSKGCNCPLGFKGDGVNHCEGNMIDQQFCYELLLTIIYVIDLDLWLECHLDIDECKEKLACQCPQCKCKNTWGSYECSCSGNLLYIHEHDTCISMYKQTSFVVNLQNIWYHMR